MLAGSGLGDDALLAHPQRQQRLPDGVVELVRAGVAEVFALEVDVSAAEVRRQPRGGIKRRRPADECMAVARKLELKLCVRLGFVPHALELLERPHERLGDVLASIRAEPAAHRVLDQERISVSRTAWTKARTFSGSLTLTEASTPLETSTP